MRARVQAESDSAQIAIQAQVDRLMAAFAAGQADSLAALYAPNAVVMPPGMPAVSGRDSIREWFAAGFVRSRATRLRPWHRGARSEVNRPGARPGPPRFAITVPAAPLLQANPCFSRPQAGYLPTPQPSRLRPATSARRHH